MSLSGGLIAFVALAYMATLFTIAFYGDRRRAPQRLGSSCALRGGASGLRLVGSSAQRAL